MQEINSPQPSPTQSNPPAPQENIPVTPQKILSFKFFIITIFIAVLLSSLGTYLVLKSKSQTQILVSPTSIPTQTVPSPTPDETANWKSISLNKLRFKIPNDWWSRSHTAPNDQWIMMNPTSLEGNPEPIAAFEAHFYSSSLQQKKQELVDAYPIDVKTVDPISVDGVSGEKITGLVPRGPIQGRQMQLAFLPAETGVYVLIDFNLSSVSQNLFDQILSTFRFLDQK